MDISNRVFGSNVSKTVREYITNLQAGTFDIQPGEEVSVKYDTQSYIGERTPYCRMWTAITKQKVDWLEDPNDATKKKWTDVGERENFVYTINENRNQSYSELEPTTIPGIQMGYKYIEENQNNPFLKPQAGIKRVNSKSEGSLGALRRTTVEFVVHNKQDFEDIYLPFFLKPGATIFVDFGWSDEALNLYIPENKLHVYDDLSLKRFWTEVIQKGENSIEGGFQTTIAGQVVKYDVNVDQNGSFNCTLEIVSGNYRLLDKTVSEDNDLKFVFNNSIEELLLGYYAKISGINVLASDLADYREMDEKKEEERIKAVRKAFDESTKRVKSSVGLMSDTAKRTGVFFQQMDTQGNLTDRETLYISFGLFEDKFLNNFISEWVELDKKTGKVINVDKAKNPFSPSFTSINTFVRWDSNLFAMMKTDYQKEDKLISFLYPDTWEIEESYNQNKPNGWGPQVINNVEKIGTSVDKQKRRIPLRDLFISVSVISEAFKKATNVNDALEYIFDQIYEDSGNILNIKMITPNESQSALTFTDINVETDRDISNDEVLQFDITSGNTMVQSFDLKMETPKAGLASMIAIGNLSTPTIFDELELMKFNSLNAIQQGGGKYQVQHLPVYSDLNPKKRALTLQLDRLLRDTSAGGAGLGDLTTKSYSDFKTQRAGTKVTVTKTTKTEIEKGYEGEFTGEEGRQGAGGQTNVNLWGVEGKGDTKTSKDEYDVKYEEIEEKMPTETPDGRSIFYANSNRDYYLLLAKINNFIKTNDSSISPVMPITLSLKVYGNNFLGYGDFFTVNYLPRHYQERVFFQIVGIDHQIDTSGWSTNYTTVMRLKSTMKYHGRTDTNVDDELVEVRFHELFQKVKADNIITTLPQNDVNPFIADLVTDIKPGASAEYAVEDDIKIKFKKDIKPEDLPTVRFTEEIYTLNPKAKKEEIQKSLEKLKAATDLSITAQSKKFPMAVNLKDMISWDRVCYWINISELILSDDLINWEAVKKDYSDTRLNIFGTKKSSKRSLTNKVYVFPRLDTKTKKARYEQYNWSFNWRNNVLELFDTILEGEWKEVITLGRSFDSAQTKIDKLCFASLKNRTSQALQWPDARSTSVWGIDRDKVGNPYLFRSMFWDIPQDGESEWSVIQISGADDVTDVLPQIVLPKKYLNTKTTLQDINTKWCKKFLEEKGNSVNRSIFTEDHYSD